MVFQSGAALAYVLALIAIVGLLVGMAWRLIRTDNSLASRLEGMAQARLVAEAGIDYALARIGPPESVQDLAFSAEDITYRLEDSSLVFDLQVRSRGLYARARSRGHTRLPLPGHDHEGSALLGQAVDLGGLPALCLMNHEGNMVLAGSAQVTGHVLLWRGDVRKGTSYEVRWKGTPGPNPPVWDSASPVWKRVRPDFRRSTAWVANQTKVLADRNFNADGDYDSGEVKNLILPDSALVTDTVLSNTRILASRCLRIGAGARLQDCKLVSGRILIEGDARLERVIAYSGGNLDVKSGTILGGQFVASDSLRLATDIPMRNYPVFFTQGRIVKPGKPDSSLVGALIIDKARGQGIFLAAFPDRPVYDQAIRLAVAPGVDITGLMYCGGHTQMEGTLHGSLICQNLKFEFHGTIWLGHLKDAHVYGITQPQEIPAPLLFPGSRPVDFGRETPR